tara:strand:+ start:4382 stop:5977 length:1596 start_codon:yes stop_codon:yes gene_type:complete
MSDTLVNGNGGYMGNPLVKKDGIQSSFSEEEVAEYLKCMNDPIYFAETYVKVISLDDGLVSFKPYEYQKKMFEQFNDNRFNIVLACRQSGKSISSVIYILWYAIFNAEKTIAILANKGSTAREMLSRITLALENLPFFLQPGCKALNKGSVEFSNNSKIVAAATSSSSIRGLSVNLLFLDEFAFVENATQFYTSTYPVVSSGQETKVIITSTANGIGNMFCGLWEAALKKKNEYSPFRVDWWDVPGRDESWKAMTIANTSELQFDQEFGNSFIGTSNTLISSNTLMGLQVHRPERLHRGVNYYEDPELDHQYIMTVDVSKGRGQDYSSFTVIDATFGNFRQVATYRDNMISPMIFGDIIVRVGKEYNDALVIIENNDAGMVVCNDVYYEHEYENTFVESSVRKNGIGVMMTKRIKRIGCSNLKDLVELGKINIVDENTILELSTFEVKGSSYEASTGNNDDMAMNLVLFAWFVSSEAFGDISTVDLKEMLFKEKMEQIDNDVPPFGIIVNSSDKVDPHEEMANSVREWHDL